MLHRILRYFYVILPGDANIDEVYVIPVAESHPSIFSCVLGGGRLSCFSKNLL